MSKIKKSLMAFAIAAGACVAPMAASTAYADEAPAADSGSGLTNADGSSASGDSTAKKSGGGGFYDIVFGSGIVGMLLWFALFGDGVLAIYFCIDSMILIKPEKLMPQRLIDQVQKAMSEGDIVAAMEACQNTPSAMSNILLAAFQHVEEGFDVIQEAVTAASDLEQEKLMQRLNWISVCSNLGPSLGLLGTVQGMILTFEKLSSGAAGDASALASAIGQALWTTAGGLIVSIPSNAAFYSLRNNANRRILRMSAVTMEFLNGLRNVEVAPEAEEAVPVDQMPA
ncbi:MAG: MotA/TolQ/ExbB proton channel family protein [Kiritimatiellae bacterium]|nr:MotA/TolQ/ExbB proton channel family protein [Kiritimatiellia bacterium]